MKSQGKGRLIIFQLSDELYGVEIRKVKEVVRYQEVTELPEGPDFVRGIIKSRNQRIPVIDLKKRFGVSGGAGGAHIIMILDTDPPFGAAIDGISRIINYDSRQDKPLPEETIGNLGERCVDRVIKTEEELVLIITPERILTQTEKEILKNYD